MNKKIRASYLAKLINASLNGTDKKINSLNTLTEATEGQLAFCFSNDFESVNKSNAGVIVCNAKVAAKISKTAIVSDNPKIANVLIARFFSAKPTKPKIHKTAIIGKKAVIGKNVAIGAYSVIGDKCIIKKGAVIGNLCTLENNVVIGEHSIINPHSSIGANSQIGNNCLIHKGVHIGTDGFGYTNHQDKWVKIPQLGNVLIADNVEIGAGCCIDRATFSHTIIGRNCIIDNLCHIAHNVTIGENTLICAGAMIAGSAKIGKNCIMGGVVTIKDNVSITDNVILTGLSTVLRNIETSGRYSSGLLLHFEHKKWLRASNKFYNQYYSDSAHGNDK